MSPNKPDCTGKDLRGQFDVRDSDCMGWRLNRKLKEMRLAEEEAAPIIQWLLDQVRKELERTDDATERNAEIVTRLDDRVRSERISLMALQGVFGELGARLPWGSGPVKGSSPWDPISIEAYYVICNAFDLWKSNRPQHWKPNR